MPDNQTAGKKEVSLGFIILQQPRILGNES